MPHTSMSDTILPAEREVPSTPDQAARIDPMRYKTEHDQASASAMDELSRQAQEFGMGYECQGRRSQLATMLGSLVLHREAAWRLFRDMRFPPETNEYMWNPCQVMRNASRSRLHRIRDF